METSTNVRRMPYAPTEMEEELYPESDGKPMADTDLHIYWITRTRDVLRRHFLKNPEVYISGNIMMYDIEGPMRTAVSPDILVCFGLGQKFRRTYKVWEEGKPPDFVMEFSSKRTYRNDLNEKMALYARMAIPEYFVYDPDRRYLSSPLLGFRLVEGKYVEVTPDADGRLHSEILNLDFQLLDDGLGIYDSEGQQLRSSEEKLENAEERAENAEERAENAEERAENAEAEVARLQAELEHLKARG